MSITLHTASGGGIFDRFGYWFGRLLDIVALQGGTATARVLSGASVVNNLQTIAAAYDASPAFPSVFSGAYTDLSSFQSSYLGFVNAVVQRCQNTIIQMAAADTPSVQQTLAATLTLLATQMKANSQSINASTVAIGAQTASGSPNGNPTIVLTADRPDGLIWQNIYPETLTFQVSNDSQSGATLNQEPLSVTGAPSVSNTWAYNWPGGSGASLGISMVDPTSSNSGGNATTNGSFETWSNGNSAAPPDNWVALVGSSQMSREATNVYFGTYAMQYTGDSSSLTSAVQPFNTSTSTTLNAGGTPYKLAPSTQYAAVVYYQLSSASPAAGVLEMSLVDQNNNITTDAAGNSNSVTVALSGVANTSWHALTGVFRTPALLPSQLKLRIRLSTALTTGTSVYLDGAALSPVNSLYTGGPSAVAFAGNTKVLKGDTWTFAVTNTMGLFAEMLQRAFNMTNLGIQLPYNSGSPTVPDGYIQ